jgi:ABC-type polar amino acid transport system ATPase subunit
MRKIEITVPDVAHVVVSGPTQCGKSIVLARIERMLHEEFGAHTISHDLDAERRAGDLDDPKDWEKRMVKQTTWVLTEVG